MLVSVLLIVPSMKQDLPERLGRDIQEDTTRDRNHCNI